MPKNLPNRVTRGSFRILKDLRCPDCRHRNRLCKLQHRRPWSEFEHREQLTAANDSTLPEDYRSTVLELDYASDGQHEGAITMRKIEARTMSLLRQRLCWTDDDHRPLPLRQQVRNTSEPESWEGRSTLEVQLGQAEPETDLRCANRLLPGSRLSARRAAPAATRRFWEAKGA